MGKVGESYSFLLDFHVIISCYHWAFAMDTLCHLLPRSRPCKVGFSTDNRHVKAVVKCQIRKEKEALKVLK